MCWWLGCLFRDVGGVYIRFGGWEGWESGSEDGERRGGKMVGWKG